MKNKKEGPGWVCLWERLIRKMGDFVLVHDGTRNPGQFEFPPDEVRFYTRVYQWVIDGEPVNTFVKFKYDLREGEVDVDLTWREPKKKVQREGMVLTNAKEKMNG